MEYNKETNYNEKIKEKVDSLLLACRVEGIPCFVSVAVANDNKKTLYKSDSITPNSLKVKLTDDKISSHINVLNGFKTVPYTEIYKEKNEGSEAVVWAEGVDFEEIIPQ